MLAATLANQRDPDADEGDGHHVPAEPCEPADQRLDAATQRAGQVDVDRQADQQADGDERDAGELVLTTLDRVAQLDRRPVRRASCSPTTVPCHRSWTRDRRGWVRDEPDTEDCLGLRRDPGP